MIEETRRAAAAWPSIYDGSPTALTNLDWSRPLFVQASRQAHFDEVVGVVCRQIAVPPESVTRLVAPTWTRQPWHPPATTIVNPIGVLDERVLATATGQVVKDASVVVVTVGAAVGGPFEPVRQHSNLIAFGAAAGPALVIVDSHGLIESFENFFHARWHDVAGLKVFANLLMSADEAAYLVAAADRAPDGAQVEVGRFTGGSTLLLAAAARRGGRDPVHSVDIEHKPVVDYLLARHQLQSHVWLHEGPSAGIAARWRAARPEPSVGLLFIDGDHSYEGVAGDLWHWTPLVVNGGLVALHDANLPGMGVSRAAYHHLPESQWTRVGQADSLLLYQRRPATGRGEVRQ